MGILQSVGIALEAIGANLFRSMLTMLGIFVGVASLIVMLAFGNGAQEQIAERIRTLGSNLLVVRPGSTLERGVQSGVGSKDTLTEEDALAIARSIPGVIVAAPTVAGHGQLVYGNQNWNTLVGGVNPDYLIARDWRVEWGRSLTWEEQEQAAKVVVLGRSVVERIFAEVDPIGRTVRISNVPFTVVGVLAEKGSESALGRDQDDVAFVPLTTAKVRLLGSRSQIRRSAVDLILVKFATADEIPRTQEVIAELLRLRHRIGPENDDDFHLHEPSSAMEVQVAAKRSMTLLLAAIASVSVVVGGISIMNIMLVSVAERTREIGLRQALGARRSDVRSQFLVEAVMLCLIGGAAGAGAGICVAVFAANLAGWPIAINPASVIFSLGFAATIGAFFGFYPANKASKLDPIATLRAE